MPTIVKVNKYQRPLLFISCNLLIDTEISGIRRNKLKVKLSPENKIVSRNVSDDYGVRRADGVNRGLRPFSYSNQIGRAHEIGRAHV